MTPGRSADRQPPPTSSESVTVVIFSRPGPPASPGLARSESPFCSLKLDENGTQGSYGRGEGYREGSGNKEEGEVQRFGSHGFFSRSIWFYVIDRTFLARFPRFVQRSIILDEFLRDFLHFAKLFSPSSSRERNALDENIVEMYIYMYTFFVGNFVENRGEKEWRPAKKTYRRAERGGGARRRRAIQVRVTEFVAAGPSGTFSRCAGSVARNGSRRTKHRENITKLCSRGRARSIATCPRQIPLQVSFRT